ncbi:flagellar biosynthesis anti-sigma factor FlgM [Novosphingobium sp. MBES04]|uniref:flagellar biosynthesis anti-sigma factor FlgM n=1 Tax=Novosphingobium sp. MBES04 TaxID=1206458 RepID=UPI00057F6390|nr:flagellar biosynthesis anti-sigma factor FlgM [Novosphingobium sp. MBES04]GAM03385.1 hypothetical conserved protein [Novosphingobium sp. MBES04]
MPPIEVGPAQSIGSIPSRPARPSGGEELAAVASSAPASARPEANPAPSLPAVETSAALDPGAAPVDTDRVSQIRKAVEAGTYPLVPAQIADAMIAAGVMLRTPK